MDETAIKPRPLEADSKECPAPFPKRFNPESYPLTVRHRVEIDYANKLSQEEKRWLACFNEAEYGGNPKSLEYITGKPNSEQERKRMYREIKRYQRDLLTSGPGIDIEFFYWFQDTQTKSSEDGIIEMIDSERRIERIVVDSFIMLIKAKNWIVASHPAQPKDALTSKDEIHAQTA